MLTAITENDRVLTREKNSKTQETKMRTITKELTVYNHTDLIMPENAKVLEAVKEAMRSNLNENYESIADNEITHFKERL